MGNTIQIYDPTSTLPHIYDLKGSWNNRIVVKGENQTKKDRNLLNCVKSRDRKKKPGLLQFIYEDIKRIHEIIELDTEFLKLLQAIKLIKLIKYYP